LPTGGAVNGGLEPAFGGVQTLKPAGSGWSGLPDATQGAGALTPFVVPSFAWISV